MRKRLTWKKVVGFIAVFCLLFSVANIPFYSAREKGYQYPNIIAKTKQVKRLGKNYLDAAIIGDSEAWSALGSLQMFGEQGVVSYNCATSGQWIGDSVIMLKNILKTQNPSVVIFGANTVYTELSRYQYPISNIFPIFHYHGIWKKNTTHDGDAALLGASISELVVPYTGSIDYMSASTQLKEFPAVSTEKLNEIYQICKDRNIQLILVSSPSATNWTWGKHAAVAAWCESNDVPYIDYNDPQELANISFNWATDTRDAGEHVNANGSKKVSSDLGKRLVSTYGLKDRRNDPDCAKWLKKYQETQLYWKGASK